MAYIDETGVASGFPFVVLLPAARSPDANRRCYKQATSWRTRC